MKVESDTNHNGKIDTWSFYGNLKLKRQEQDRNGDGLRELAIFLDTEGEKEKVEFDSNGDGKMDTFNFYSKGELIRQEQDRNYDPMTKMVVVKIIAKNIDNMPLFQKWYFDGSIWRDDFDPGILEGKYFPGLRFKLKIDETSTRFVWCFGFKYDSRNNARPLGAYCYDQQN